MSAATKMQKELEKITGVKPGEGEAAQKYLERMLYGVANLPNDSWEKLSKSSQNWYEAAAEAWNKKKPNEEPELPSFEESLAKVVVDAAVAATPATEETAAVPAVIEAEAAPTDAPAAKPAPAVKVKKQRKPKEEKEEETGGGRSPTRAQLTATRLAITLYIEGPKLTIQSLTKAIKALDPPVDVPNTTIRRAVAFVPLILGVYAEMQK